MKKNIVIGVMMVLAVYHIGRGQSKVILDKVLGTVGSKIILRSDIKNQMSDLQRQGVELPENPECILLEQEIIKKAMVMQAEKDSLLASDDEIENEIDNRIKYFMSVYGGKEELEQVAGKTIYQMKDYFRLPIQENLLARNMQRKIMDNIKVTPLEVKHFYDQIPKDSLPIYESEYQIGQLILYVKPSKDVEEYAVETLKEIKADIESGKKTFESLVQIYSDDPGSKNTGGRYEVNKNEKQWDPVFLSTAFRLKEGEVSKVVKSKFGYHIIQLVSRYGDDAVVRHILKIPQVLDQDIQPVSHKLDSIRHLLVSNQLTFGKAVSLYNEDENAKFTAGFLMGHNQSTTMTIDQIDKDIVGLLEGMKVGDYSQPLVYKDPRGKVGVRLIYIKSRTDPHRENIEDDYLKISQRLIEQKKADILNKWIDDKVPNFYLQLDDSYKTCSAKMLAWTQKSQMLGSAY